MEIRDQEFCGEERCPPPLYSIGHGARSAAEFVELLRAAAIGCIADVRSYPGSRRHPQFARQALGAWLNAAGIDYRWLGKELGGFRHGAKPTIHTALASEAACGYADHMASAAFREGIVQLLALGRVTSTAMLCAESLPQHCHRAMIADYLTAQGITVIHLVAEGRRVPHCRSEAARWVQGRLIYDLGGGGQQGWEF